MGAKRGANGEGSKRGQPNFIDRGGANGDNQILLTEIGDSSKKGVSVHLFISSPVAWIRLQLEMERTNGQIGSQRVRGSEGDSNSSLLPEMRARGFPLR